MEPVDYFRNQADECHRLANDMAASFERKGLLQLARHYEAEARRAALDAVPQQAPAPQGELSRARVFG